MRDAEQILDAEFLEHRAKVLDVAAFLDRLVHAKPTDTARGLPDPRIAALHTALHILQDPHPRKTQRLLEAWSDPTEHLLDAAPPTPVLGVPCRGTGNGDQGSGQAVET